jgi:D-glycero-alpha-D-manno-heptose-7-phosphate kinase
MIITKTPVRIPLGGGGTDLSEFYCRNGAGYTLSLAINKYVFCIIRRNFEKGVRFTGYHKKEIVSSFHNLENSIAKAVFQYLDFQEDIEIITISDVRTNCGLGTSSAFVVGLLHALKVYRGELIDPLTLARDAVIVEREILKENGGVQDQYSAALGGLVELQIDKTGLIEAKKINLNNQMKELFENFFVMYDTRVARVSSNIQAQTIKGLVSDDAKFNALKQIFSLGRDMKSAILDLNIEKVGSLMNSHWNKKKLYSPESTGFKFEDFYNKGIDFGAIGGKLMGAGGGGYFLFVVKNKTLIKKLNQEFLKIGFMPTIFQIADNGSEIVFKGNL